jgi:endonuclease-3
MAQEINDISPDPALAEKAQQTYEILKEVYGIPEWREPLPPVDELISTILSQNTNDINRDVAFNRLKEKFPNWESVRDAAEIEVIEAIRPAGLANQKGPRMQAILRQITEERGTLDLDFLKGKQQPSCCSSPWIFPHSRWILISTASPGGSACGRKR